MPLPGEVPDGDQVIDVDGMAAGRVRAVYSHYLAVDGSAGGPAAYRVPRRAIASIAAGRVRPPPPARYSTR
jgi:hypothetical protein